MDIDLILVIIFLFGLPPPCFVFGQTERTPLAAVCCWAIWGYYHMCQLGEKILGVDEILDCNSSTIIVSTYYDTIN